MVRSIAITLAAVAAIEAGSTFSSPALARGMGGMGHTGIAGLGVPSRSGIGLPSVTNSSDRASLLPARPSLPVSSLDVLAARNGRRECNA